jgi:hypothetical protein
MASLGHVKDLPKRIGVDVDNGFEPHTKSSTARRS